MLTVFTENAALLARRPDRDVYVSIGFHEETAVEYLPALRKGIEAIKEYSQLHNIPYEFTVERIGLSPLAR